MPKPKPVAKSKRRRKGKPELQQPSITATKTYWVALAVVFAAVSAVFGTAMDLSVTQSAVLVVTVVLLIGVIGFIRTTPSDLTLSKRATFIFAGASIIGFCIWAAIVLSGLITPLAQEHGKVFIVVTSFTICLTVGAFIGELLGRSKKIQDRLFLGMKD